MHDCPVIKTALVPLAVKFSRQETPASVAENVLSLPSATAEVTMTRDIVVASGEPAGAVKVSVRVSPHDHCPMKGSAGVSVDPFSQAPQARAAHRSHALESFCMFSSGVEANVPQQTVTPKRKQAISAPS
jgi:hypothetical protein